jgi:glycosyltransferase involved in cell wall biosynthesis
MQTLSADGRLQPLPWSSRHADAPGRITRALDTASGLRHSHIPGPAHRWQAAWRARAEAGRQDCKAILHLGTYDVAWKSGRLPEYLYVDNTYDLWESQATAARELSPYQRRWYRRMEQCSLRNLRHIFTVGQHVAENLASMWGVPRERISTVGAGLGGITAYNGPKDYRRAEMLIVAKVRPNDKGLPLLLAALQRVRQQRPDATLTVIGGANYPEVAVAGGATGTGWIDLRELQQLYEKATLFVMPATYEPWGLSYIEALACRTPVVGLARNAFPEISGNGRYGFILSQTSPQALAALLLDAFSDPQRLEQMGREGQQHVLNHYRWEQVANKIADVISNPTDSVP